MNFIRTVGAKTLDFIQSLGSITLFLLRILTKSATAFTRPRLSIRQVYFSGVMSVLIIAVSGLFVGMVLGLQGYTQLAKFKSADILGYMVAASLLRELGPVLAAVLFARRAGTTVIWRCHLGGGRSGEAAERAWAFLDRYLEDVDLVVVSREEYRPPFIEPERCAVVKPSINPDSPKNRVLDLDEAWSVARLAGIFDGEPPFDAVPFVHEDGRPDAIRRMPSLAGAGLPVPTGVRTIVQVGRWDRLKGARELIGAFASNLAVLPEDAHLLIVGPDPDPNRDEASAEVLGEVLDRWDLLPESVAGRVHIAAVPMHDREVNATVVNAVQRVADVVTQRSLVEAFGLPVAEAMWKKAAVVASAVGGIQDQIVDGVDGVLVDSVEAGAWAEATADLLRFPARAREMGLAAHESVRREFLPDRHLSEIVGAIDRALELRAD